MLQVCARIEFTYWACAHWHQTKSKWLPSLRPWACIIDTIGSGQSDAHRELRQREPERYKMELIYV